MCIEPWEALQQELEQSQALALLTAVELLQSMCKENSNAGEHFGIALRPAVGLVTPESRGKPSVQHGGHATKEFCHKTEEVHLLNIGQFRRAQKKMNGSQDQGVMHHRPGSQSILEAELASAEQCADVGADCAATWR